MAVSYGGGRFCLVCGRQSFLTVHRKCSRKFESARARSSKSALAGRGQQPRPSAEVAAVPATLSDASAPVGGDASRFSRDAGSRSLAGATASRLIDRSEVRT